ncbi:MAG: Uma2 family endonuclease [Deltaproteobacteria bacterium]|nr:Uma2 family endonuclease [Deltaproteobacteria bacterium]
MPAAALAHKYVTYAEYLAKEAIATEKHEWYDGHVLAMAGGTPEHSYLSLAVGAELRAALRGGPCRPFESNQRLRSETTGLATYADAVVICGPMRPHPEDPDAATNPTVIVEVLSPSTEAYDRGQKFEHYRTFPSLRDFLLVTTGRNHVDHFTRNDDGTWTLRPVDAGGRIGLAGVEVVLDLDAIYEGVEITRASG